MINVLIYSRRKLIIRSQIIIFSVQFGNYNSFMYVLLLFLTPACYAAFALLIYNSNLIYEY